MSDWHCKQIPNRQKPIVVCERETLTAEIERLCAAGDEMADAATRQQWSRLDVAVAAWQEARRD